MLLTARGSTPRTESDPPMSHCTPQFPLSHRKTPCPSALCREAGNSLIPGNHSACYQQLQAEPHSAKHSQLGLLGSARNCFRKQQHNPNIYLQCLTWTLSRSQCEEGISTQALSTARKVSERCDRSQSGHTE